MGCIYRDTKNKVRLMPMNAGIIFNELAKYYSWMTSEEVTKYNSHGLFPKSKKAVDEWVVHTEESHDNATFGIFYRDEWVGVCSLQSINWINRSGEIAIYIGDSHAWGKGVASIAVGFLLRHGFGRLGLNRIWSGTAKTNTGMNRVFEKCYFAHEGSFREGMFLDGEFVDVECWSILKAEYERKNYAE